MEVNFTFIQLKDNDGGETSFPLLNVPVDITVGHLNTVCNKFLKKENASFLFFKNNVQIRDSLLDVVDRKLLRSREILDITYTEQVCSAGSSVQPVIHCTSFIGEHAEAVISASFSPDSRYLASGSGDTTVKLWDVCTETPRYTCKAHKDWVLCIAWSPNGLKLASGCKNGQICIWDGKTGKQIGKTLSGHGSNINALSWEPLHRNGNCRHLASASKDSTVRVWDTLVYQTLFRLCSHTDSVTCVRWGGSGLIYSGSHDRTIKVHQANNGALCRTLKGHGHWVNTIALNTDYVMRTGQYDPSKASANYMEVTENTSAQLAALALKRYEEATSEKSEIMASGSYDNTAMIWAPEKDEKFIAHLTGHSQAIIDVKFSPDMNMIATASFDKSIKVWDGTTGKFKASLCSHTGPVYQISWSADSRLLVSGSVDSTLKLWNMDTLKYMSHLIGNSDEIYAVDWSPDGQCIVSGGKGNDIRIWRP